MKRRGDLIGEYVEAQTNGGRPYAVGEVVAYVDAPTVIIKKPNGERVSWRADMLAPAERPVDPVVKCGLCEWVGSGTLEEQNAAFAEHRPHVSAGRIAPHCGSSRAEWKAWGRRAQPGPVYSTGIDESAYDDGVKQ